MRRNLDRGRLARADLLRDLDEAEGVQLAGHQAFSRATAAMKPDGSASNGSDA